MFSKINTFFYHLLNIAIAFSLAAMSIAVFGNVVLRYVFNSGLTWSEEMSRYFFVWLVFLGAIVALREKMHLGVDLVVKALPRGLQKVVFVISNGLVLYLLYLIVNGSWKMSVLNMNSTGPVTGMPLSYLYGIGVVSGIWMMAIVIGNVYKALKGETDNFTNVQTAEDVTSAAKGNTPEVASKKGAVEGERYSP